PAAAVLVPILAKSTILAITAGYVASHTRKVSLSLIATVVFAYQTIGGLFEWAWTGSIDAALQDFSLGIPGMLLQIVGGYLFIKYLLKK
ncbi:MAG: ECF transporter S component, partial [Alistipes sp.]|nr:ECF transporter S component [Alistipes sp.]